LIRSVASRQSSHNQFCRPVNCTPRFLVLAIETSAFAGHSGQQRTDRRISAMSVLAPNDGHGFSSFSAIGRSAFMSTRPRPPAALRQYDDLN
jgi:hypothetical protein